MAEELRILYEDPYLVVCVKPVGVLSEDSESGRSLPRMLAEHYRQAGKPDYIATVHRLDKIVGGVMVLRGHPREPAATLTDLLFRDASHNKSYVVKRMRKGVREARLSYEEVGRTEELSLVRVQLYTGRTHQIRVQFASRGLPLLGDIRYGSKAPGCTAALWSYHLGFRHPVTGKPVDVTCPPPQVYPWDLFGGVK